MRTPKVFTHSPICPFAHLSTLNYVLLLVARAYGHSYFQITLVNGKKSRFQMVLPKYTCQTHIIYNTDHAHWTVCTTGLFVWQMWFKPNESFNATFCENWQYNFVEKIYNNNKIWPIFLCATSGSIMNIS